MSENLQLSPWSRGDNAISLYNTTYTYQKTRYHHCNIFGEISIKSQKFYRTTSWIV